MNLRHVIFGGRNYGWKFGHMLELSDVMWFWDTLKAPASRKLIFSQESMVTEFMILILIFSDDVCVLSAIGTAAIINPQFTMIEGGKSQSTTTASVSVTPKDGDRDLLKDFKHMNVGPQKVIEAESDINATQIPTGCFLCHIPHSKLVLPVSGKMKKCAVCK